MSWPSIQNNMRPRTLALSLVEILDHQPSVWAAAGDRKSWSYMTPFSPLFSSWAKHDGTEYPPSSDYLRNHQPALGCFLSPPSAPWRGNLATESGVKCCLCLGDKEQSGSSGSAASPWLASSLASPRHLV